eukprot:TRINITY_DN11545_c0_g1_i1.p1 TRINITY_DN11545_c0_g1~~TRINITY_DN11545_c0_g1_i1.p1  ORF type:complete len:148 (+),score=1.47 TRINITY_DN11545_c0_g1_i1:101-544(+)
MAEEVKSDHAATDIPGGTVGGGCHCGASAYEVTLPTSSAGFCHCKFCRSTTGAAFYVCFTAPSNQIKWTKTEQLGVFAQNPQIDRLFCKNCGTSLGANVKPYNLTSINYTTIKSGELDRKPSSHMNLESKADFYMLPDDGLPRKETW